MNPKKLFISIVFIVAAIASVSLFWEKALILIIVILVLAIIKHKFTPIKHEIIWFIITGFIGAGGESIIMRLSGVWTYTSPQLINIPYWLPFLWGFAGVVGISLYQSISKS